MSIMKFLFDLIKITIFKWDESASAIETSETCRNFNFGDKSTFIIQLRERLHIYE